MGGINGPEEELAEVAGALGVTHADRLAGLLLARKQHTTGEYMLDVWTVLFGLPVSQDVKSDWLARMAALAPSAWIPWTNTKAGFPSRIMKSSYRISKATVHWRSLL